MTIEHEQLFHNDNPDVYRHLKDLALVGRRSGMQHCSIMKLFAVLRWEIDISTTDPKFKINNNLMPFYARLLMEQEPELEGFFRLRRRKQTKGEHYEKTINI